MTKEDGRWCRGNMKQTKITIWRAHDLSLRAYDVCFQEAAKLISMTDMGAQSGCLRLTLPREIITPSTSSPPLVPPTT